MAERKRVPTTDQEWIRRTEERLRILENRRAYVLGVPPDAYLLEVDVATGNLIATHTTTGTVTVVATP